MTRQNVCTTIYRLILVVFVSVFFFLISWICFICAFDVFFIEGNRYCSQTQQQQQLKKKTHEQRSYARNSSTRAIEDKKQ